jgi:hypothetical protein
MDIESIRQIVDDRLRRVNTCMPGIIESYDAGRREAEVAPQIDDTYASGDRLTLPVLTGVPVVQLTSADAGLILPIAVGDRVLVLFAQRSMDRWLATGNRDVSGDARMHAMSDALAIAGLCPFTIQHADGDGLSVFHDSIRMRMHANKVAIGTDVVELLDEITKALDATATSNCVNGSPLTNAATIQAASTAIKTIMGTI